MFYFMYAMMSSRRSFPKWMQDHGGRCNRIVCEKKSVRDDILLFDSLRTQMTWTGRREPLLMTSSY